MYECPHWADGTKQQAENHENDFDELATTIREMGWGDDKKKSRSGVEKEEEEESPRR